ncbi:MAG TPA: type IV secretion system DNA-binding domain-containing protein [Candidatus Colwellbacteria bacterium]|nr:type IV secretion system DNA-binding domain-containing protein [Candidatus Colwellbacteria bacterium]
MDTNEVIYFGQTNFRNRVVKFGIKTDDRRRHMYMIGKSGVGKTTMMERMFIEDVQAGHGAAWFDPHGDAAEKLLGFIPAERINDVIYFNPADTDFPIGFNALENVHGEHRHLVASGIMSVFKKIWPDVWSARMEYILNNTLLALLEYPGSTLLGIMRMLAEKKYRETVVDRLEDPVVKSFWVNEFARYTDRYATEAVGAIQNKVGQFVANPLIRNVIGQQISGLNMRSVMDEGKILIANLARGKIGEDNSNLLGAMLITKLQQAAMSRADVPEAERRDFFLYIDEFQNFSTDSFAVVLSEARKYRLSLVLAHQYLEQLTDLVKAAIIGNVGTMIVFRVGAEDAEFLEKEFLPEFEDKDLVNLSNWHAYIKMIIDGSPSRPFSIQNLPPALKPTESFGEIIIEQSRKKYGTPKATVEKQIAEEWTRREDVVEEKAERRSELPINQLLRPKERKPIIIDDLRKALSDALGSNAGQPETPQDKNADSEEAKP